MMPAIKGCCDIDNRRIFRHSFTGWNLSQFMTNLFWYSLMLVDIARRLIGEDLITVFVRNSLYCLVFAYVLLHSNMKRRFISIFALSLGYVILLFSSLLIYPVLWDLAEEHTLLFYVRCVVGFYLALNVTNWRAAIQSLARWHWIGLIYAIMIIRTGTTPKDYMLVAYALLVPTIVTCAVAIYERNMVYMFSGLIMMMTIIIYGARGPVVCIIASTLFLLYRPLSNRINIRKIVYLLFVILGLLLVLFEYSDIIILLNDRFPEARSVALLVSGRIGDMAGRDVLYYTIINSLFENWLIPQGFMSDRIILSPNNISNNMYPHNLFLEVIYQFGLFGVLCLGYGFYKFIKSYHFAVITGENYLKLAISAFVVSTGTSLMISGSYISHYAFWYAVGTLGSISRIMEKDYTKNDLHVR